MCGSQQRALRVSCCARVSRRQETRAQQVAPTHSTTIDFRGAISDIRARLRIPCELPENRKYDAPAIDEHCLGSRGRCVVQ